MNRCSQPKNQPRPGRGWKVLLVNANCCTTPEPVFPLGLAHVSAALANAGHEVEWLDLLLEGDRFADRLRESGPDLVGISVRNIDDVLIRRRETFIDNLAGLVASIRQKQGCPVVLGGSGFSIMPRELLQSTGAELGITGEGEAAFLRLVVALENGEDYSGIPGLVFRCQGRIVVNSRGVLDSAAAEPPPRAYFPARMAGEYLRKGGILNLQTQRGCAHHCCYCTYPVIEGTRLRRRSAEDVAGEFEQLQRLGARYAFVVDSVFNSSEAHVHAICEALLRRELKMQWGCFLRPQRLTRQTMRLMARAGLAHIEFGSDSFSDEVLAAYQKDLTFEDILRSTELARAEAVDFCHFVIAGGPGETEATLARSFENSRRLGNPIILAVPGMRIYPGTRLFQLAVAEGGVRPETNLLTPAYYLAPGLTLERVMEILRGFAAQSPNWVVGDSDPAYDRLVARLRQRGVTGPLWSYLATAQRLWPARAGQR